METTGAPNLCNFRCGLGGCDINRRWKKPKKSVVPEVNACKELIKLFSKERNIKLICDLHGHSKKFSYKFNS